MKKAQVGVVLPHSKGRLELPEAERCEEGPFPRECAENGLTDTFIWDFRPPELRENIYLLACRKPANL